MAEFSPEVRERMRDQLREHAAQRYGIIECYGPDGEYYEARSHREATQLTGIPKSSVGYALKNGTVIKGWQFKRDRKQ